MQLDRLLRRNKEDIHEHRVFSESSLSVGQVANLSYIFILGGVPKEDDDSFENSRNARELTIRAT